MRTIRTKVYKFDELTPDGKKKAIQNLSNINTDYDWYEFLIEDLETQLDEIGFEGAKIAFSGFSSQGDGASFDATINLEKFTTNKRLLSLARECDFRIDKTSFANHYSHEKTRFVEYNAIGSKRHTRINEALQNLSNEIEALRLSKSKEIYRTLEEDFEYRTSEEAIIETIKANEYEFYANGKLI